MAGTMRDYVRVDKECKRAKRRFKAGSTRIRASNLAKRDQNLQIRELAREKDEAFQRRDELIDELLAMHSVPITSHKELRFVAHLKMHHNWAVRVSLSGIAAGYQRVRIEDFAAARGIPVEVGP